MGDHRLALFGTAEFLHVGYRTTRVMDQQIMHSTLATARGVTAISVQPSNVGTRRVVH
jgi:hypothetical protein